MTDTDKTEVFIQRWQSASGSERSNCQLFVTELCALLGLPQPEPASDDTSSNAYVFERRVTFAHGNGSQSAGFIDCYRRGAFVLEGKRVKAGPATPGFDDALMRARNQAEGYARALPADEGRPPFLLVVDVGNVIELYAEFTRSGATYTPFPDARSHRLKLADLHSGATQDRLRLLWLDPMALDPARASAKVTREVAARLATLARDLEADGHPAQAVAAFLTRCLFCMFAEDVGLLPTGEDGQGSFVALLQRYANDPVALRHMLRALWADMDKGGFSAAVAHPLLRFNGKLFKGSAQDSFVLPLLARHISGLLAAAQCNWREVEPAIFGTLLERALSKDERHALGAHYTPRAYVERLVLPTVVEPLRADWADVQAAALILAREAAQLDATVPTPLKKNDFVAVDRHTALARAKWREAQQQVKDFHHRLCAVRVLDPACGSGNFLYVALEHFKRLEGEVLEQLAALGEKQVPLETVTPQQFLGIEINERAAALAELVLWIGYLQWHIRSFGTTSVAEPVIHDYGNIENRDAVLAYDGITPMFDAAGQLVQRWDGKTFKTHPVTGEQVPDETAMVPQWRYVNPRPAVWPQADFIVGNPPFLGARTVRSSIGDGYLSALRSAHPNVPDNADYVMHWWDQAASLVRTGSSRQFGLITTKAITQAFCRPTVEAQLSANPALTIKFAIPNHPWMDSANGAAVRVAMTVGRAGRFEGVLQEVVEEHDAADGESGVLLNTRFGNIDSSLRIGFDLLSCTSLGANQGLCSVGFQLTGKGFVVNEAEKETLQGMDAGVGAVTRPLLSGRDLTQRSRALFAVDVCRYESEQELRGALPAVFHWLSDRVKPERALNPRASVRNRWWIFGEPRNTFRPALVGIRRAIATSLTARHRTFQFVPGSAICDSSTVMFALENALQLGVLSSCVHTSWSVTVGGRLGVGNDPRYNKSACFDPFSFPHDDTGLTPELTTTIRDLAEQLDAHRKAQQATHPALTLTGMYNVLDKLRTGEALNAKDKISHNDGLVLVLKSLHDELDAAVLAAYGWADLQAALGDHKQVQARAAAVETLLERLVALNAKRAAEEAAGYVRWLRPDFQKPGLGVQAAIETDEDAEPAAVAAATPQAAKRPWPTGLPEQVKAVADTLASSPVALSLADIEACFTARGRWRERLPTILDTLEALGRARHSQGHSQTHPPGQTGVWQSAG
jgi:hypothetical protein